MNMDATIDRLVDTCESNWVEKQALGPVGSKLTASALLALAGGAAGAGAGFMFDRGHIDPDESPGARARKMKQRMLRGAGIGAAVGGAAGLMAVPGPRPLEPHERADAIKTRLGPTFIGGAAQEATVREHAGLPVNNGLLPQMGRVAWDSRPEILGGTEVSNLQEVAGTVLGPLYVYANRANILRNRGIRNYWRGIGGEGIGSAPISSTFQELRRMSGIPGSADYSTIVPPAALQNDLARTKILQALVARQGNPGNVPGLVRVPQGTPAQLEAMLPRQSILSKTISRLLMRDKLKPYRDVIEHQMKVGPGVDAAGNIIPGVGDPRRFHAGEAGWGKGKKLGKRDVGGPLKAKWKPGNTSANLALGRRMALASMLSYYLTRVVNNSISNIRVRGMAKDVADKLVA